MNCKKIASIALLASAFGSCIAQADQINILNSSFEGTVLSNGAYTVGTVKDWTVTGSSGTWNPLDNLPQGPTDGVNVGYSNAGSLSQVLSATLAANTTYTLSVDLLNRNDGYPNVSSTLELYAGNNLLSSSVVTGGLAGKSFVQSLTFSMGASGSYLGQNLMISLTSKGAQSDWDNVKLTAVTAVPEPETYAMLLAGLGLMGGIARRRNKK